jgi:diaminohydroxyphosphoribosylaminopyrimidine deaminase/5-amino-6-(5-phosphoribosylamino)uracil reductase
MEERNESVHERMMRRVLALAEKGAGRVNPNPLVGAVLVRDGKIIAEAYHERSGGLHAEALVLNRAGGEARGAALYVNWEPCVAYPGKRTPPCVDAIIRAGVCRVIVATRDPTPEIRGCGIEHLKRAGIEVIEGVLEAQAKKLNEIRAKFATTGRPFVTLKMAMTADGKIATRTGDSRWISSEASRELVHELRARYAAVLVGIGTVLWDDPRLTVRRAEGRDPLRIVLDSQGRIPRDARILHVKSGAPTAIATCAMPPEKESELRDLNTPTRIEIWRLPADSHGRVDLQALLGRLGEAQIDSLLVEGGSTVAAAFLRDHLLDKLTLFIAPKVIGGREAPTPIGGEGVACLSEAVCLKDISIRSLEPDVVYEGYFEYPLDVCSETEDSK